MSPSCSRSSERGASPAQPSTKPARRAAPPLDALFAGFRAGVKADLGRQIGSALEKRTEWFIGKVGERRLIVMERTMAVSMQGKYIEVGQVARQASMDKAFAELVQLSVRPFAGSGGDRRLAPGSPPFGGASGLSTRSSPDGFKDFAQGFMDELSRGKLGALGKLAALFSLVAALMPGDVTRPVIRLAASAFSVRVRHL